MRTQFTTEEVSEHKALTKEQNHSRTENIDTFVRFIIPGKGDNEENCIKECLICEGNLQIVASKPTDVGYQDSDIRWQIQRLESSKDWRNQQITALKRADADLIKISGDRLSGLSREQRENHPVMKDHRKLTWEIRKHDFWVQRINAAIEVMEEELSRRESFRKEEEARITREHEEWKEKNKNLLTPPKKRKGHTPSVARNETRLASFEDLVVINRKKGVFSQTTALKKADVLDMTGWESIPEVKWDTLHVFEDGRTISRKKVGAVTRFFLNA